MGRTSPSRAQHRGPTSIPQETGNMGSGWSTAAGSHPCFSRLICWFYEIHSPLFSHFSPSLFIAGFIYMNRALRVLSRQSAVAELGAGEGSRQARQDKEHPGPRPRPPPARHVGGRRAGRQPSLPRRELPGNEPEPNEPQTHARPGPIPAGHSDAGGPGAGTFPPRRRIPSLSKADQLWQQCFAGLSRIRLSCRWPGHPRGLPGSKGDRKRKKLIADQDSVRLPFPFAPPHGHREHRLPHTAESLDNCPAINLPLCLTRGIKMLLILRVFFKTLTDEAGVLRLAQGQETWGMQLSPSHAGSSGRVAAPVEPCCQLPGTWLSGSGTEV